MTLEESDSLQYTVSGDTVPSGPQVWKIDNTGEMHAHHAVFWRIPDGVTADDIVAEFSSMMSGTPPAGPPLISQFVHVGYAALQSGGQTTWIELDLTPGSYAVICFIIDPMTGRPACDGWHGNRLHRRVTRTHVREKRAGRVSPAGPGVGGTYVAAEG